MHYSASGEVLPALAATKFGLAISRKSHYFVASHPLLGPLGRATMPQPFLGTLPMSKATARDYDLTVDKGSGILNLTALERTPLARDPFDHVIVPGFIGPDRLAAINADYPDITGPGNVKLEELRYGPAFADLIAALDGPAFRERISAKFGLDLTELPQTVTVRRFCEKTDGHIHVDHRTKVVTMILYFNEGWDAEGGRLRFLRSVDDIEDYAVEVTPTGGTMLAFRRSDRSFHGHKEFVGERRIVQVAWVRDGVVARTEKRLNRASKPIRRLLNMS